MASNNIYINNFTEFFNFSNCSKEELFILLKKQKLPLIKEFCKINNIKKITGLSKIDLISKLINLTKEEQKQELSTEYIDTSDDDSDYEEEVNNIVSEDWDFPELDTDPIQLDSFLNDNKFGVVLIWSNECDPCINFKPKFKDFIRDFEYKETKIPGALINVEVYEEHIESPEGDSPTDVEYLPTIKLCKDGTVFKTLSAPTIKQLEKNIKKMLDTKPSVTQIKQDLKLRGLPITGKKEDLYNRLEIDIKTGFNYHLKTREELISILTRMKVRSKKHEEMDQISLIKKIRKQTEKLELSRQTNPEVLRKRLVKIDDKYTNHHVKILKSLTVKQLRILVENGFPGDSNCDPLFICNKQTNKKALTKNEIIEKLIGIMEIQQ